MQSRRILLSLTAESEEPQSIHEALNDKSANKWKQALEEEVYNSRIKKKTWDLHPPTEGCNVIGSKWVIKVNANGDVERHKDTDTRN